MSRTPNWTITGLAWHRVLCLSHCVKERIEAHRFFSPDPLAFDWTSAPALDAASVAPDTCVLPLPRTWH